MRLYAAFLGLVSQPHPRGALSPRLCRINLFGDVRADTIFFSDGLRGPNFMVIARVVLCQDMTANQRIDDVDVNTFLELEFQRMRLTSNP